MVEVSRCPKFLRGTTKGTGEDQIAREEDLEYDLPLKVLFIGQVANMLESLAAGPPRPFGRLPYDDVIHTWRHVQR